MIVGESVLTVLINVHVAQSSMPPRQADLVPSTGLRTAF